MRLVLNIAGGHHARAIPWYHIPPYIRESPGLPDKEWDDRINPVNPS